MHDTVYITGRISLKNRTHEQALSLIFNEDFMSADIDTLGDFVPYYLAVKDVVTISWTCHYVPIQRDKTVCTAL